MKALHSEFKILIIDDSKVFLSFISEMLSDLPNTELKKINDPRIALEEAISFQPDLILTDFEMPYLNGNEICRLIKNHPELSTIPVIMLTANNHEEQLVKAIEYGANDYLWKSSKKEVVIIKVKGMLKYKKLVEADIKLKQLEAVKALVATSNHEFNNALFISNGHLKKLEKSSQDQDVLDSVKKIKQMNERMEEIVKHLESIKEINLLGNENEIKMLKI